MVETGPTVVESQRRGAKGRGGRIPGAPAGQAAFTLTMRDPAPVPVLIAVPHAGRAYPAEFTDTMRNQAAACLRLEDRFADLVAEAVARETGAALLVAHAPRALIDLNRAPDDVDWDMVAGGAGERRTRHAAGRRARSGLGLVPRRLPGLGEIWKQRITQADLDARIDGIHAPYHAALAGELSLLKARWGAALLVDLHSMPPLGPKRGTHASADFVVGDRFGSSCDGALCAAAFGHFAAAGRRAAHNRPYAGGYGLDRHAAPARGFHGLQIEICRAAYLDERLCEPGAGFDSVAELLTGLVRRLASEFPGLGGALRQAAE